MISGAVIRAALIGGVVLVIGLLMFTLNLSDHHPDGRMLQYYLCNFKQPPISNGIALLPYHLFTDCLLEDEIQIRVLILNFALISYIIFLCTIESIELKWAFLLIISFSFLLYTSFFPSKEILLTALLLIATTSKNKSVTMLSLLIVGLIRPAYIVLLLYRFFNERWKIIGLVICIALVSALIQSGYAGQVLQVIYEEKKSEYDGVALPLFDSVGYFDYVVRIFWNFIGLPGSLLNLYSDFTWHIFMHIGTQVALLIVFPMLVVKFFGDEELDKETILFVLFAILSATWPVPHTRYLYPIIIPLIIYFSIQRKIKRRISNVREAHL